MALTVFLDLDGTLIDPKVGITSSIQFALEKMGAEVPHQDELEWCIGPPLWESFAVLLGESADLDEAVGYYRERFIEDGLYEADVYDGIGEMLESLGAMNARIFIATSKPHAYANEIADHFGLSSWVDGLFGSELDGTHSDKTSLLAHALLETETEPSKAVMIGDRRHDIDGARNNFIPSIGVTWGFAEEGELHAAEPDALAGSPEEIPEIIADLLVMDTDD